ncbi:reverse transcriptase [Tanacetum coccineum]
MFRFENMWLRDENIYNVVRDGWAYGLAAGYFSKLFSSSSPQDCESAVNDIDRSLTDNERHALERRVTSTEIFEALMQMDPSKAPGPDGMTAMFYQKFWCFTAFVSDRVITDNAIVAFEVFHWLKKKKDGRKGALTLKIDMSKAYDRVEWPFIQAVLSKFGFPSHFSNLIMACVSSVSLSFNIKGQVSEVLSSMIRKSVMEGHSHGVKVCRGAPEISHLFFADDSIFFTRSSVTPLKYQSIMAAEGV